MYGPREAQINLREYLFYLLIPKFKDLHQVVANEN